ncbi:MAG: molybdopterin-dependent oxidoreductase [bacterium]|nr:molybdopterin-dependent oxidoreductase [bacterium]
MTSVEPRGFDRRQFLSGIGTGSALLVGSQLSAGTILPGSVLEQTAPTNEPLQPSIWLAIAEDGSVRIWTHRSEMGTGIRTSLPMVVADELGADWDKVTIEQALGDRRYGSQNTDGSRSIRRFYEPMRRAGAAARAMLEQAAAKEWNVDAKQCAAREHAVHGPDGKRLGFGELVAAARELSPPKTEDLTFRKPAERRYVGKDEVRFYDLDDILMGKAKFGADVRPEGMVFAAIWRVPVLGGTIDSFDATAAKAVPGVTEVVELDLFEGPPAFQALGGIAVIGRNTHAATRGRDALEVKWSGGDNAGFSSPAFDAEMQATAQEPGRVVREVGDVDGAMKAAGAKHEAMYTVPFLAHAQMEPLAAVASVTDGKCTVWAPTQNPQAAQGAIAAALGINPKNVEVHVTLLGGGFGRKSKPDFAVEAALLAQKLGKPVRVQWTREDDTRFDYYHSAAAVHVEAGLGDDGMPTAWLQRSVFPPISLTFSPRADMPSAGELGLGFTDLPYPITNIRCEAGRARAKTRIGWMRSVHHVQHAFSECSFVDELAAKAGADPLEYLVKLIGEPRHVDLTGVEYPNQGEPLERYPVDTGRLLRVLKHVAEKANWGRKLPQGKGLGIAAHRSFLGYVATVVEVEVSKAGTVRIPRVDIGIDAGTIVNPDRVRAQLEGAATFGIGIALLGEITFADGAVQQGNYHDFLVPRMPEAPREVHTYLLPNDAPPSGVGETGTPPMAPALCNAIFAATGKRVRRLPIKQHDLSWG